jgi:SAM-dependent methyltransferase
VISAPCGAPRCVEASIADVDAARYDGHAEWHDRELARAAPGLATRAVAARLLGHGAGLLLDVGCGSGAHVAAYAELGWDVTGVDVSEDQLRLARARGVHVVRADAAALPFADAAFDAAVSTWTHTDVDDFATVVHEVDRILRKGAPFVYVGAHPCFVGPHSLFAEAKGVPALHAGYRATGFYTASPGTRPTGLRAKVGATHLPLALFLQAFLDAGFTLERVEEAGREDDGYPFVLALRARC